MTTKTTTTARTKKPASAPAPRPTPVPAALPANDVPDDIAAAVEAQLAAQRAELTAKLLAERAERERKARKAAERKAREAAAAEVARVREDAAAAAAPGNIDMDQLKLLLAAAGVKLVPQHINSDADAWELPETDYSDTERVQVELNALLDLLGVVRVRDVIDHVKRDDGEPMSPSNVRYHMRKLAHKGQVKKIEERYYIKGLGWRTRDCWSKDPQKLFEVLEGKKPVKQ